MTKAGLICIVLFGVLAFAIFSPGFSFSPKKAETAPAATLEISSSYAETGVFEDSEPLFLPTRWNFGTTTAPEELRLQRASFLPFAELLFTGTSAPEAAMKLKYDQTPPRADEALGADAWAIARGFGAGTLDLPAAAKQTGTRVRIENAETGAVVFEGEMPGISGDDERMLLAPAEFLCGITSGFGEPRVLTVASCGDPARDAQIRSGTAEILKKLELHGGIYSIFVDLR